MDLDDHLGHNRSQCTQMQPASLRCRETVLTCFTPEGPFSAAHAYISSHVCSGKVWHLLWLHLKRDTACMAWKVPKCKGNTQCSFWRGVIGTGKSEPFKHFKKTCAPKTEVLCGANMGHVWGKIGLWLLLRSSPCSHGRSVNVLFSTDLNSAQWITESHWNWSDSRESSSRSEHRDPTVASMSEMNCCRESRWNGMGDRWALTLVCCL